MVVDATGTVWTVGENDAGQLGNESESPNNASEYPVPLPVSGATGFTNVVSVAAGYRHTLALCANGTVWAWGTDLFGAGSNPTYSGVLGAGNLNWNFNSCGCFTNSPIQSLIPAGTIIVAIAAGNGFSLALDSTGLVWGWGDNSSGEIGPGIATGTNLPTLVQGISNVIAIAAGDNYNSSAGGGHSVALDANGQVWTWGDSEFGELGQGPLGTINPSPGLVTALTNQYVVAIAAGVGFTLAVTSNGQVYAWGDNSFRELGTNTSTIPYFGIPMLVPGISNVVLVSAPRSDDDMGTNMVTNAYNFRGTSFQYTGGVHAMAMTVDGGTNHYWGWGDNSYGEVGQTGSISNGGATNEVSQYAPTGPLQFCTRCQREVQLGTEGTFTAQCNGTLYLYFNTDNFGACTGQYNVAFGSLMTNVPANASTGVAVASVTNGGTYSYSASGWCTNSFGLAFDPNGRDFSNRLAECSSYPGLNTTNTVCPMWQCFSLVGKIQ